MSRLPLYSDDILTLDQIRYWLATGRSALAVIDDEVGQKRKALADKIQAITRSGQTPARSCSTSGKRSARSWIPGDQATKPSSPAFIRHRATKAVRRLRRARRHQVFYEPGIFEVCQEKECF